MTAPNINPIFAILPYIGKASFTTGSTALTSRTDIVGITGLTQLTPVTTNGLTVSVIRLKGSGTTIASLVSIWIYDGTTSRLYDEIAVTAITPNTTANSFFLDTVYTTLQLGPTDQLYASVTVATNVDVFVPSGEY